MLLNRLTLIIIAVFFGLLFAVYPQNNYFSLVSRPDGNSISFLINSREVNRNISNSDPNPYFSFVDFHKVLYGWIQLTNNDLDFKTMTCVVDNIHDLTGNLIFGDFVKLEDVMRFNWQCEVPQKLNDGDRHLITITVMGNDGNLHEFKSYTEFNMIGIPHLVFATYPYVNYYLPKEEREPPDPFRIKVNINQLINSGWDDKKEEIEESFRVNGVKPVDVECDMKFSFAIITVSEPLTEEFEVSVGPVTNENGIVFQSSVKVPVSPKR